MNPGPPPVTVHALTADARVLAPGGPRRRPKITVVTPTYRRDREGLLRRCLESAVAQTFVDYEHVIVDDGSDDGTPETVLEYARRDDRIVYVRHDRNCGLPAVRTNEGVTRARGEAVAFLFDDCVWEPDFLERAWGGLQAGGADMVHARVRFPLPGDCQVELGGETARLDVLGGLNTIANTGVLCRRDLFDRVGLYDPHVALRRVCDWDLWLRALRLGARFQPVDGVAGEEGGMLSPQSLANAAPVHWLSALALMQDEAGLADRAERLRPGRIETYDVAAPEPVLAVVRDRREWEAAVSAHWAPLAGKLFGADASDALAALRRAGPGRVAKRAAVVCNRETPAVRLWSRRLREADAAVLRCAEWQLPSLEAGALDLAVLIDAALPALEPAVKDHRAAGATILYVEERHEPSADDAALTELETSLRTLVGQPAAALPRSGVEATPEQVSGVRALVALSDAALAPEDSAVAGMLPSLERGRPAPPEDGRGAWLATLQALARVQRKIGAERQREPRSLTAALFLTGSNDVADARATHLAEALRTLGARLDPFVPELAAFAGDPRPAAPFAVGSTADWPRDDHGFLQERLQPFLWARNDDLLLCAGDFAAVSEAAPPHIRVLNALDFGDAPALVAALGEVRPKARAGERSPEPV